MYFRCSVKLSPCITKYFENVFLQLSQFLSKFEHNFSHNPPNDDEVARVGIYCDGSCNPNDRYFTVGVEKLKEIGKLRKPDSRTYVKTRTALVCGDKSTENRNTDPKEQRNSMDFDRDLEKGLKCSEDFDIESNHVISSDVPIKQKNEDGKFKVKLKMSVVGKIEEMQLENDLEDGKPAKNIENLEEAKLENELEDENPVKDTTNLKETKLKNELEDKKSAEDTSNKEDLSPIDDKTNKGNKNSIFEEEFEGAKSDEIEIDISWFEDNQHVLEKDDPGAESASDSEKNSENSNPDIKRTNSQNEYQRFINEFADFKYSK